MNVSELRNNEYKPYYQVYINALGNGDFKRVKVGIGRPPARLTAEEWVLQNFSTDEREIVAGGIDRAAAAAVELIQECN